MRRAPLILICLVLAFWLLTPMLRAVLLLQTFTAHGETSVPASLHAQPMTFRARGGVQLHGWLVVRHRSAPAVILVAGFKDTARSMAPYASFLAAAGYTVLLYDGRGVGASSGTFSLGLHEVDDVLGAVAALAHRPGLQPEGRYGVLGVSMGAGVAIVAASRSPLIRAVVADSAYVNQRSTVDRLNTLRLGPLRIPLAPVAPAFVDAVLQAPLSAFSPLQAASRLGCRRLLLIHSLHDANVTTPASGVTRLRRAAGGRARLWFAPRGGHAAAFANQPRLYERHVLHFFHTTFSMTHQQLCR